MKRIGAIGWTVLTLAIALGFYYRTFFYGAIPAPLDTLVGLYHPFRDRYASEYPRGVPFKNFLITDPVRQQMPWRALVLSSWSRGEIPKWNPYNFAGAPLDANIQSGAFYPLNIIFAGLSFLHGWALLIILQSVLGIWFMYGYLRSLSCSPVSSVIGSVAWAFGGFSIAWLMWGTMVHAALWLPLILLGVEKILTICASSEYRRRQAGTWAVIVSLGSIMTITAGHAQIALYVLGISVAYVFWRTRNHRYSSRALRFIIAAGLAALVVSAVSWLPFLRQVSFTVRADSANLWKHEGWFVPWRQAAQFIAPDYFGNPATLNYWGAWNYGEFIGYIGVVPLVLAFTAVGISGVPMFFTFAGVICLLCIFPNPIAYAPFLLRVPILSSLQPTRLLVILNFSLSVLAAFGYDAFVQKKRRTLPALIVIGLGYVLLWTSTYVLSQYTELGAIVSIARRNLAVPVLVFIATIIWVVVVKHVLKFKRVHLAAAFIVAVVVADVFRFGWKFTPFVSASYFFPETEIIRFLSEQQKPYRIMSLDDRILPPNVSSYYGIESIEGYDPLVSRRFDTYLAASERGDADITRTSGFRRIYTAHNIDSKLLPYLNVRYVLSLEEIDREFLSLVITEGNTRVYEYATGLPRAYIAEQVMEIREPAAIIGELMARSPARVGIVERTADLLSVPLGADETVRIEAYGDSRMTLRVIAKNTRLVVVLHAYDSRWTAVSEGKELPVMRVNYLFSGIIVPPGIHTVEYRYR